MSRTAPTSCPPWCARIHGEVRGEDDAVHVSEQAVAGNRLLRLCATIDPVTGEQDGPYVLVGHQELTLDEAEDLLAALTALVSQGRGQPVALTQW
jgi:uncharacterized protein DUF6907